MSSGLVHSPAAFDQRLLFKGCEVNGCTPSDIDAAFEFQGKLWFFIEVKRWGLDLTVGQERMYRESVDAILKKTGAAAYALLAWHTVEPPGDIILADCIVASYYHGVGKWVPTKLTKTVHYTVSRAARIKL